jgi:imidazolonepropionase-like amidohydrolase
MTRRRCRVTTVVLAVALSGVVGSPGARQREPSVVINPQRMIDVVAGRAIDNPRIVIEGGRIVAAGPAAAVAVPANASVVDLPSTTVLPGLIDAHVHLTLGGDPRANARATLEAGFTTVQDLGAAAYSNVRLREAIKAGKIPGPRVVASGPWLGISGGICDFNGIGVRGAEAFRQRVRTDVEQGVDLIKVCVTGWLAEAFAAPSKYEISDAELSAAIEEAHTHQKRVAVHAISEGGIDAAVRFGADLVVHGGFTSNRTVAIMKQRGILQLPTLFSFAGGKPEALRALQDHLRGAVAAGLPIAFGTDAGVIPHGENAREFEHLAAIGLDPRAAIRAATVSAAAAVGLSKDVGVLSPGRLADVIGVVGNPLEDVRLLQKVQFVMKEGVIVKRPANE